MNPKTFIENSNTMDDIYKKINDYNLNRNTIILILFADTIF